MFVQRSLFFFFSLSALVAAKPPHAQKFPTEDVRGGSQFPSLRALSSSEDTHPPLPPIKFPATDLSPITVEFADPSLRNYPDPSVPAAAVESIRVRRETETSSSLEDQVATSSESKLSVVKAKPAEDEGEKEEELLSVRFWRQFEEEREAFENEFEAYEDKYGPEEKSEPKGEDDAQPKEEEVQTREGEEQEEPKVLRSRRQSSSVEGGVDLTAIFSPEFIPLPVSDPDFALPIIREDPGFFDGQKEPTPNLRRPPRTVENENHAPELGSPGRPKNFRFSNSDSFLSSGVELEVLRAVGAI